MKKRIIATMLALPLALSTAFAQEAETSQVKISGFGTAGLAWANTDAAQFGRSNQASGAGKHARTGVDSNLGLQADYAINDWLSVTGQGLVRKDGEDDYGAEIAWAFAKAKVSEEVSVRIGRMGLPVFMISDYRNVGYANTFIRPPIEMYSQVPFNGIDGIDLTWQHSFGGTNLTTQVAAGRSKNYLNTGVHLNTNRIKALNIVAEHGPVTMRVGRAEARVTIGDSTGLNTLYNSLHAVGTGYHFDQLGVLADAMMPANKKATFTSAGAALDWNDIVLQSEFAKRKTDSYINDTTSWYVMAGYRIGKILPYYTHAKVKADRIINNTVPASCPTGYPAACTPTVQALSAAVNQLPHTGNGQGEQTTDSIGVRWDFYRSVDLKVQVDRVRPVGPGLFLNPQAGFKGPVTVGAVALDFVF